MKILSIVSFCLLFVQSVFSKAPDLILLPSNEIAIQIYSCKKQSILITDKAAYKINGDSAVEVWRSGARINSSVETDTCFWLATQKGLVFLNKNNYHAQTFDIPALVKRPEVTAVLKDAENTLWVGCEAYGFFKMVDAVLVHKYAAFPVLSAAFTADSALWVGTMSGLNRFHKSSHVRYNEEGVANFEIPGNVVDKLLVDNLGHLWIFTSEGISVFGLKGEEGHGHLPSVKFLGSPENQVSSVYFIDKCGYLFSTSMGLLLLPEAQGEHVEALEESGSDKVENKALLHQVSLGGTNKSSVIQKDGKHFWVSSGNKITRLSESEIRKSLKNRNT